MSICSSITNAASNISTSGVAQSLGQVLGVLGAADVAIRLGSGGQAGVLDLPSLLSETAGIPCYSPELGDFIYVTPLQFWANGGKCDGLRDPDREAIEERIRERQERAESIDRIRQRIGLPPGTIQFPPDTPASTIQRLEQELLNAPNPQNVEFLTPGTLIVKTKHKSGYETEEHFSIVPGDGTFIDIVAGWSGMNQAQYVFSGNGQGIPYNTGGGGTFFLKGSFYRKGGGIENPLDSRTQWPNTSLSINWVWPHVDFINGNYNFIPSASSPSQSNGIADSIPINPPPTPDPPEETPCMGGCSCRDISGAQQQRLNNLEKLVKEIHKAVGAQNFISTYTFAPEQNIENAGKKIYQGGFGRAGTIQANNLIDVMNGLIASEYYRLGLHRFPAKVPDSLIPNPNSLAEAVDRDVIDISDLAGFQEWWFKQWNAWSGKWPIEFEVTDDGKKKPVKLWNLEHAIAELYAGNLKIIEDSDQGVQWGLRAATEASKAGNAALKALHILNELVKLTGAITGNETIKVKTTFTPNLESWQGAGQSTEEMLKSSEQDLIVTDIKDNRTLIGLLLNISYWAQIAGKAVYSTVDTNPATGQPGMPGDAIKAERKKDKQRNSQFEKEWDKWKREIQIPNNNGILTPDAVNPPTPNITEVQRPQS